MTARLTANPSSHAEAGEFIGRPVRLPHVMLCGQGERFCGKVWTANTPRQLAEMAAERRTHEAGCQGGLILDGGR